jgi:hypothetical protein
MAARVTLRVVNDELARRGHHARREKASGYFYFWSEDAADWIDRTVRLEKISVAHVGAVGGGVPEAEEGECGVDAPSRCGRESGEEG